MIYKRENYILAIRPFIDAKIIKILAGVRRCGKSCIFDMVKDELIERGIKPENIIKRVYTDMDTSINTTEKEMYDDIKKAIEGKGKCYLLLDEVQEVDNWEKVVNSLFENSDVDIYITGSNSKLLSGEISTYLTGRFVSIPVYTLSFAEYKIFKKDKNKNDNELLKEYIRYGGFPLVATNDFDYDSAYQIVQGIYTTVVTKDIAVRHNIRNQELFDRVIRFVIENVGKTFSANTIVNFLKNEKRNISVEAIYNYLKWLQEAFIIYKCQRYDIQGKMILKTQEKYYLSDISIKYVLMGYNINMIGAILENIVYLELKRRGYDVYIGKLNDKEIDFIASKREEKIYVQVCEKMPQDSTREIDNLLSIKDQYHKYVVTLDELAEGNVNGVQILPLGKFLTDYKNI